VGNIDFMGKPIPVKSKLDPEVTVYSHKDLPTHRLFSTGKKELKGIKL